MAIGVSYGWSDSEMNNWFVKFSKNDKRSSRFWMSDEKRKFLKKSPWITMVSMTILKKYTLLLMLVC